MVPKFDVAIVGAGVAGCLMAAGLAKKGLSVCLIERKPISKIGVKVCGDALIADSKLKEIGFQPPKGYVERELYGFKVYVPGLDVITLKAKVLLLDREGFGRWLFERALDQGVTPFESTIAINPIISDGWVKGVKVKRLNEPPLTINSGLTVDASGVASFLRRKLPREWWVSEEVTRYDLALCYREIRLAEGFDDDYCSIYYDQAISPMGYLWIFPKSKGKVNVGVGLRMNVKAPLREVLHHHLACDPRFNSSRILHAGWGVVPARHPLKCFTSNGFMVIGDAAYQATCGLGEGLRPSIVSAYLAAQEAAEAAYYGLEDLWGYNVKYLKTLGLAQVQSAAFTYYFERLSDERRNKLLSNFAEGSFNLEAFLNFKIDAKILAHSAKLGLQQFKELIGEWRLVREVKSIYTAYPEASKNYPEWSLRADNFWSKIKASTY
ncbi:MAG: NAD(P)/FAD-dependent oxidoreductase [Candidatus Nezhaarchaeales archaeon]